MNIQTFLNGELVDESEVEGFYFAPNVSGFTTAMLFSQSYMKLINEAGDKDAKTRLELLSVRLELKPQITVEDLQIFKLVWDTLISSVSDGILGEEDRQEYNQIAEANHMPFRFGGDLRMEILAQ